MRILLAALFAITVQIVPRPAPHNVFGQRAPRSLRVMTWNVGSNSVVPHAGLRREVAGVPVGGRPAAFARVVRAVRPDVACLQEFTSGSAYAARLFDAILPLPGGARWHGYAALGNVIVSRYPLADTTRHTLRSMLSQRAYAVAALVLPDTLRIAGAVVVCTHLQSGGGTSNVAFRMRQAVAIVGELARRDSVRSRAALPRLSAIVLGDLNAIDTPASYIDTLLRWPLTDALPLHNAFADRQRALAMVGANAPSYTWRDDRQRYAPGRLDRVLFDPGAFTADGAFVLETRSLDPGVRQRLGLDADDTVRDPRAGWVDHLPVVVDLAARAR
ncbi:MAG TPA: endonuclease/exonuclease/phosphatase family protein [Gemmatimonas sp.]|nr:endonuclease/exonuclease/phosphatase family protein [Gemmatimonas sp.]